MMAQCAFIRKLISGYIDALFILEQVNFQAPSKNLRKRPLFSTETYDIWF